MKAKSNYRHLRLLPSPRSPMGLRRWLLLEQCCSVTPVAFHFYAPLTFSSLSCSDSRLFAQDHLSLFSRPYSLALPPKTQAFSWGTRIQMSDELSALPSLGRNSHRHPHKLWQERTSLGSWVKNADGPPKPGYQPARNTNSKSCTDQD